MHVYTIDRIQYNVSNHLLLPMSSEHFGRFQHHHLVFPSMAIGTMQNIHYLTRNHLPRRVKELIVPVFNFPPSYYRVYMFLFIFVVCMQAGGCYILCASVAAEKKAVLFSVETNLFWFFFYRTIMIYRSINLLNWPQKKCLF